MPFLKFCPLAKKFFLCSCLRALIFNGKLIRATKLKKLFTLQFLLFFRFDADPNSLKGAKQLKHWLKTFVDFLERYEETSTAHEVKAPKQLQLKSINKT